MTFDREFAFGILKKYTKSERLLRHALAVEAVMKHFAGLNNEDELKWGNIGLLHDIDYEMYPDQHCYMAREILEQYNFPEEYIHAVESHGYKLVNDIQPMVKMEKVLYAIDELTGLVAAVALVRPSKSILDIGVSSVNKKWKQRDFAAGVSREAIEEGSKMLNVELDYLIENTIEGMKPVAEEIGLKGEVQ